MVEIYHSLSSPRHEAEMLREIAHRFTVWAAILRHPDDDGGPPLSPRLADVAKSVYDWGQLVQRQAERVIQAVEAEK